MYWSSSAKIGFAVAATLVLVAAAYRLASESIWQAQPVQVALPIAGNSAADAPTPPFSPPTRQLQDGDPTTEQVIKLNPDESLELRAVHYRRPKFGRYHHTEEPTTTTFVFDKEIESVKWQISDTQSFSLGTMGADATEATLTANQVRRAAKATFTVQALFKRGGSAVQSREVEIVPAGPEVQVAKLIECGMMMPSLAVDLHGHLHALAPEYTPVAMDQRGLDYVWQTAEGWEKLKAGSNQPSPYVVQIRPMLVIDSKGVPHAVSGVSSGGYGDLKLVYHTLKGQQWIAEEFALGHCTPSDFAIDSRDRLHLAFRTNNDQAKRNLQYALRDDRGWLIEMVERSPDSELGGLQEAHGLTIDNSDNPLIAYQFYPQVDYSQWNFKSGTGSYGPTRKLQVARRTNGKWSIEAVPGFDQDVYYALPLVARDDTIHLLTNKDREDYPYSFTAVATKHNGRWTIEAVDGSPNINRHIGLTSPFALDEQGRLCLLSLAEEVGEQAGLYYLRCEAQGWQSYLLSELGHISLFRLDMINGRLGATFQRNNHEVALWRANVD